MGPYPHQKWCSAHGPSRTHRAMNAYSHDYLTNRYVSRACCKTTYGIHARIYTEPQAVTCVARVPKKLEEFICFEEFICYLRYG